MRQWREAQDDDAANAGKNDPEPTDPGQPRGEPKNDPEPKPKPSAARAKDAKKTADEEQENEWATDNRKWESEVESTLNNFKRLVAFRKRCTPEQWQRLARDVDPALGARVRNVCEEGLELADVLDEPLEQEADALTETGRVKTTPAKRPSRPVQAS